MRISISRSMLNCAISRRANQGSWYYFGNCPFTLQSDRSNQRFDPHLCTTQYLEYPPRSLQALRQSRAILIHHSVELTCTSSYLTCDSRSSSSFADLKYHLEPSGLQAVENQDLLCMQEFLSFSRIIEFKHKYMYVRFMR